MFYMLRGAASLPHGVWSTFRELCLFVNSLVVRTSGGFWEPGHGVIHEIIDSAVTLAALGVLWKKGGHALGSHHCVCYLDLLDEAFF